LVSLNSTFQELMACWSGPSEDARMAHHLTVPHLFPPPDYAHAAVLEAGERLVFTAGAVPSDANGTLVGAGDFIAQTEQVLTNLEAALRAVGSDLEQVVNTTFYVVATEQRHLSEVCSIVRASGLRAKPHTSTLLGVTMLGYTGQLVEITAVAVMPPAGSAQ
jgi:enamine deaminase RidA (YjgF/YER057c/UK114 family)